MPKISRFFFPFPPVSLFLCLSGCPLVGADRAAGVPHDNQRAQTRTFERRASKTPPKFNFPVGEQKKARNFGPPTLRAPTLSGPHLLGPHLLGPLFWVWAPTLPGPHQNRKLAKCGLAKFGQTKMAKCGQIRMAKTGLAKCGRDLPERPDSGLQQPRPVTESRRFLWTSRYP